MHHRESYHPVIGAPYINAIYVLLTWDEIRAGWRIVEKERCHPRPHLQGLIALLSTVSALEVSSLPPAQMAPESQLQLGTRLHFEPAASRNR